MLTSKEQKQNDANTIRAGGQIAYYSASSQGFDIIIGFPNNYLHCLPEGVDGAWLLLPLYKGHLVLNM